MRSGKENIRWIYPSHEDDGAIYLRRNDDIYRRRLHREKWIVVPSFCHSYAISTKEQVTSPGSPDCTRLGCSSSATPRFPFIREGKGTEEEGEKRSTRSRCAAATAATSFAGLSPPMAFNGGRAEQKPLRYHQRTDSEPA
jgi:hypothetical protein